MPTIDGVTVYCSTAEGRLQEYTDDTLHQIEKQRECYIEAKDSQKFSFSVYSTGLTGAIRGQFVWSFDSSTVLNVRIVPSLLHELLSPSPLGYLCLLTSGGNLPKTYRCHLVKDAFGGHSTRIGTS